MFLNPVMIIVAFVLIITFFAGVSMLAVLVVRFAWRMLVLTTTPIECERRMSGR